MSNTRIRFLHKMTKKKKPLIRSVGSGTYDTVKRNQNGCEVNRKKSCRKKFNKPFYLPKKHKLVVKRLWRWVRYSRKSRRRLNEPENEHNANWFCFTSRIVWKSTRRLENAVAISTTYTQQVCHCRDDDLYTLLMHLLT